MLSLTLREDGVFVELGVGESFRDISDLWTLLIPDTWNMGSLEPHTLSGVSIVDNSLIIPGVSVPPIEDSNVSVLNVTALGVNRFVAPSLNFDEPVFLGVVTRFCIVA